MNIFAQKVNIIDILRVKTPIVKMCICCVISYKETIQNKSELLKTTISQE